MNPLSDAAVAGDLQTITRLLGEGADVNAFDNCGRTALICAASGGSKNACEVLIKAGADVNALSDGVTALHCACLHGYTEIVALLIDNGADVRICCVSPDEYCGMEPLHITAANGHRNTAALLLGFGGSEEYVTPIDEHYGDGHYLINAKYHGMLPLMLAAKNGHKDVVELLIEHTDTTNAVAWSPDPFPCSARDLFEDHFGYTALMFAVEAGRDDIAEVLLRDGANPNETGSFCTNDAMNIAIRKGNAAMVARLLECGADWSSQRHLVAAAECGNEEIVRILLDAGADPDGTVILYSNGDCGREYKAVREAAARGHAKVVELLKSRGATE